MEDIDYGSDSSELGDVAREREDIPTFKGIHCLTLHVCIKDAIAHLNH